jgi:hypothetical protein
LSTVRTGVGMGILLGLLISVLLWVTTTPAQAQTTVEECQGKIDTLSEQTESATFVGQNAEKNHMGLQGKLTNASEKLAEGKYADAIQKLENFKTTVSALDEGGKIAPGDVDAQTLLTEADEAIACIEELGSTTATA